MYYFKHRWLYQFVVIFRIGTVTCDFKSNFENLRGKCLTCLGSLTRLSSWSCIIKRGHGVIFIRMHRHSNLDDTSSGISTRDNLNWIIRKKKYQYSLLLVYYCGVFFKHAFNKSYLHLFTWTTCNSVSQREKFHAACTFPTNQLVLIRKMLLFFTHVILDSILFSNIISQINIKCSPFLIASDIIVFVGHLKT